MIEHIQSGADKALRFDTLTVGHPSCNRYAMAFSINGNLYDFFNDSNFTVPLLNATAKVNFSRTDRRSAFVTASLAFIKTPPLWSLGLHWLVRNLWSAKADLWAARGKVEKLTFFIHNFMDACHLEHDRIKACIFMVASQDGPISMCLHNAKRDEYILKPIAMSGAEGEHFWQPLTGKTLPATETEIYQVNPKIYPIKFLRGRSRADVIRDRSHASVSSNGLDLNDAPIAATDDGL